MKSTRAFIKVEAMVLEREEAIVTLQEFNRMNKGNQKLKAEVDSNKILVAKAKEELKILYPIRNSFYGA